MRTTRRTRRTVGNGLVQRVAVGASDGRRKTILAVGPAIGSLDWSPRFGLKLKGLKEKMVRKDRTRTMLVALLGLFSSAGLATPTRAETGTVSVVFTKAGFVVGGGRGVLNFHGKNYPFTVRGA